MRDSCGDEVFCILTISVSVSLLWYCTKVLQDVTTEKMNKGYMGFLYIISCNCMQIYHYLKIKGLILKSLLLVLSSISLYNAYSSVTTMRNRIYTTPLTPKISSCHFAINSSLYLQSLAPLFSVSILLPVSKYSINWIT